MARRYSDEELFGEGGFEDCLGPIDYLEDDDDEVIEWEDTPWDEVKENVRRDMEELERLQRERGEVDNGRRKF